MFLLQNFLSFVVGSYCLKVGYPNVGKSSTINALMQEKKTSVSATPGKTKHFQVHCHSHCFLGRNIFYEKSHESHTNCFVVLAVYENAVTLKLSLLTLDFVHRRQPLSMRLSWSGVSHIHLHQSRDGAERHSSYRSTS